MLDARGKEARVAGALEVNPDPDAEIEEFENRRYITKVRGAIVSVSGAYHSGNVWKLRQSSDSFQVSLEHTYFAFGERKDGSEGWESAKGPTRLPSAVIAGRLPDDLAFAGFIQDSYNLSYYQYFRDLFKSHGIERALLTSVLVERFTEEEERKKHEARKLERSRSLLKQAKENPRVLFGKRLYRGKKLVTKTRNRKVSEVLRVERRRIGKTTQLVLIKRAVQKDGKTFKPGFGTIVWRDEKKVKGPGRVGRAKRAPRKDVRPTRRRAKG